MRISHQTQRVLQALLDGPAETYGFALAEATGLKAGTLYPILQRLLAEGWLEARWEEVDENAEGRRRRRYYHLTGRGEHCAERAVSGQSDGLRRLMPGWST